MPTVTYRPATLDDAALASDLMAAAYPAIELDPINERLGYTRRPGFVEHHKRVTTNGG